MTTFHEDQAQPAPKRADALDNWFTHHPPKSPADVTVYQEIRNAGRELADVIADECPASEERDTALVKVREAVMWANASIACSQLPG